MTSIKYKAVLWPSSSEHAASISVPERMFRIPSGEILKRTADRSIERCEACSKFYSDEIYHQCNRHGGEREFNRLINIMTGVKE